LDQGFTNDGRAMYTDKMGWGYKGFKFTQGEIGGVSLVLRMDFEVAPQRFQVFVLLQPNFCNFKSSCSATHLSREIPKYSFANRASDLFVKSRG
jgi:hypothetical protein